MAQRMTPEKNNSAAGKFLKFVLWTVGGFAALFVVLSLGACIYISINYPPAKLKAIATDKLSESLKRKVSIGDIHFNVLSGFEVTDLHISNRSGWAAQDFVVAKDISISYNLFPLLWGKISLGEIKLNAPQILVERRGLNQFNFSDMASSAATAAMVPEEPSSFSFVSVAEAAPVPVKGVAAAAPPSKTTLLFSIGSVNISHGKLVYLDETGKTAQRSDLTDLNFKISNVSLVGGKSSFTLSTPFDYNKTHYDLAMNGGFRYFLASQSIKELSVSGTVNGLGFGFSGSALNMTDNFSPDMDGNASLEMLKASGLVPGTLESMPKGLALSGPAKVSFHLSGNVKAGLELKGTADASDLTIQYQDMFVKAPKTVCKVDFDAINSGSAYNVKSFHVVYQDWAVDGSFLYKNGVSYSGELHTKDLPLAGLSKDVPKLAKDKIDGTVAMNVTYSQLLNKPASLKVVGPIVFKGVGITLGTEPYIQNLNAQINAAYPVFKIPSATFNGFDGTGVASLVLTVGKTLGYSYAFDLKSVNAQKLIDSSVDAYVTKNPDNYKDKLYGNLNFNYKGTGHGVGGDEMIASAEGSGNYSLTNGKVAGYQIISYVNNFFKDKGDSIQLDDVTGTLAMKNKVCSYTANNNGKVGTVKIVGAINIATYYYAPEMNVTCDIHKDFLNSDSIKAVLPSQLQGKGDITQLMADSNGNVPIDFHFTGDATKVPGMDCVNLNRLTNVALNNFLNQQGSDVQSKAQNVLNGLFGH
ncbi:MAG TPA: AsmA family protein [bacterium]|nr:AsmA family protein [bacterium]